MASISRVAFQLSILLLALCFFSLDNSGRVRLRFHQRCCHLRDRLDIPSGIPSTLSVHYHSVVAGEKMWPSSPTADRSTHSTNIFFVP